MKQELEDKDKWAIMYRNHRETIRERTIGEMKGSRLMEMLR